MRVDKLRILVRSIINEVVRASPGYQRKEDVRRAVQDIIVSRVRSGEVNNDDELRELFKTLDMAVSALKMVPLEAYRRQPRQ